jgi:hypothetical protein
VYLSTLRVHGTRRKLTRTAKKKDHKAAGPSRSSRAKSWNKAAVALANQHARIAWSLLAKQQHYYSA